MDTHPTPKKSTARAGIFGALIGAGALLGSVLMLSTGAGAQDDPTPVEPETTVEDATQADTDRAEDGEGLDFFIDVDELDLDDVPEDWQAHMECIEGVFADIDKETEPTDAEWEALDAEAEACDELLPADIQAEMEAFAPFEECIDGILGDEPAIDDNLSDAELEDLFEQFESTFTAAEEQCADLLPAELKAEMEAWTAFDDCLAENGFDVEDEFAGIIDDLDIEGIDIESIDIDELDDEMFEDAFDMGNVVFVETADGSTIVELGEGDATVTITKSGDTVDVTTTGDATVEAFDWDEAFVMDDPAFAACEDKLPQDLDLDLEGALLD